MQDITGPRLQSALIGVANGWAGRTSDFLGKGRQEEGVFRIAMPGKHRINPKSCRRESIQSCKNWGRVVPEATPLTGTAVAYLEYRF